MSEATQTQPRKPRRPPPTYTVVVVLPERPDPRAAEALLTWLAERGKR